MKRTIIKQFRFNREEAAQLKKKAKKACLSESGLVRFLLKGYEPREKPDDEFYHHMNKLTELTESVARLSKNMAKGSGDGAVNEMMLREEIDRWHRFQAEIEMKYLLPEETELKWQ